MGQYEVRAFRYHESFIIIKLMYVTSCTLNVQIEKRQAVLTPQSHNFKPAESVTVVVDLNLPAGTRT